MATMGVLHGYYVAEYRIICRDGARGTLNPLCLMAASDNKDTRELVQSSLVAAMGVLHGCDAAECRIICGDRAMGAHSTHSAWWLLAIIELPESWYRSRGWRRWGVLHDYYVAEYRIISRDGARGTLNPLCLVAASDNRATREPVQSSWMATMGVLHG
jgi:hypothetical protein